TPPPAGGGRGPGEVGWCSPCRIRPRVSADGGSARLPGMDVVAEYLRLGLRFDRLEEGFVDAFTGDAALRREVQNEPPPQPRAMAAQARDLLAALPDSGLPAERVAFLSGQLAGLELNARKFAGEQVGF